MKKKAKSLITKENQNRLATGGGPPPTLEKGDAAIEKIVTLLRPVVQGFDNGLDSDSVGRDVYSLTDESGIEEVAGVGEVALDNDTNNNYDLSNVFLVDNVEDKPPVEVEPDLSGDWSSYTASMLRAPRTNILRTFNTTLAISPNDQRNCNTSTAPQPSTSLTSNHYIPKLISGTRHLSTSSRRRPFLKRAEAEQLAQEKLKTLAGTAEQATEEHAVTMRILLLQEHQEEEKLKQQQLNTIQGRGEAAAGKIEAESASTKGKQS